MSEFSEGKLQHESMARKSAIDLADFSNKISQVVGPMDDNVALIDMHVLSSTRRNFGTRLTQEAASNPPEAWRNFIGNISSKEKGVIISTIGILWRAGIRNLGELRTIGVNDLAVMRSGKRAVGVKRADFAKKSLGVVSQRE